MRHEMYGTLYHWDVGGALSSGKKVYCVNMETNSITCLNELMVHAYFNLMSEAEKDDTKYVFYYKDEGENNV